MSTRRPHVIQTPPLLVARDAAAAALGISERTLEGLVRTGDLPPPRKISGGRVVRTTASHPSADDCASAVGVLRVADAIDRVVEHVEDATAWNGRKTTRGRRAA